MSVVLYPGVDLVVEALVELLMGPALAQALADIIADRADGIALQPLEKVFDHEVDPEEIDVFPSGYVTAVTDERAGAGDESSSLEILHTLDVGIFEADSDLSMLAKRVQRTAYAVQLCIRRHGGTMMPYCPTGEPRVGRVNWLPATAISGKPQPYLKAASMFVGIATLRD